MSRMKILLATALLLVGLCASASEIVNLNVASAETLAASLDGIGPAKAAAIVSFRQQNGPFKSVDDLLLVKGIGAATLERNRPRMTAATP